MGVQIGEDFDIIFGLECHVFDIEIVGCTFERNT